MSRRASDLANGHFPAFRKDHDGDAARLQDLVHRAVQALEMQLLRAVPFADAEVRVKEIPDGDMMNPQDARHVQQLLPDVPVQQPPGVADVDAVHPAGRHALALSAGDGEADQRAALALSLRDPAQDIPQGFRFDRRIPGLPAPPLAVLRRRTGVDLSKMPLHDSAALKSALLGDLRHGHARVPQEPGGFSCPEIGCVFAEAPACRFFELSREGRVRQEDTRGIIGHRKNGGGIFVKILQNAGERFVLVSVLPDQAASE